MAVTEKEVRIKVSSNGVQQATSGFNKLRLAAVGLAASLIALAKANASFVEQLESISQRIGIGVQELDRLRIAAATSGISFSTLETSLQRIVRGVSEAAQGFGTAAKSLEELGVDAKELNALKPDEVLLRLADGFATIGNQSDKVRLAFDVFGRGGVELLEVFGNGADAVHELNERINEFVITTQQQAVISELNDSFKDLGFATSALGREFTRAFGPALIVAINTATDALRIMLSVTKSVIDALSSVLTTNAVTSEVDSLVSSINSLNGAARSAAIDNLSSQLQELEDRARNARVEVQGISVSSLSTGEQGDIAREINTIQEALSQLEEVGQNSVSIQPAHTFGLNSDDLERLESLYESVITQEERLIETQEFLSASYIKLSEDKKLIIEDLEFLSTLTGDYTENQNDLVAALEETEENLLKVSESYESVTESLGELEAEGTSKVIDGFIDIGVAALNGAESFKRAAINMIAQMIKIALQAKITAAATAAIGAGGGGAAGAGASGAGASNISAAGNISAVSGGFGSSGFGSQDVVINTPVSVNVTGGGGDGQEIGEKTSIEVSRAVRAVVLQEIVKQKRAGGALNG